MYLVVACLLIVLSLSNLVKNYFSRVAAFMERKQWQFLSIVILVFLGVAYVFKINAPGQVYPEIVPDI